MKTRKLYQMGDYEIEIIQKALSVYDSRYHAFGWEAILDKGKNNYVSKEKISKRIGFIKRSLERQSKNPMINVVEIIDYTLDNFILPEEVYNPLIDYLNAIQQDELQAQSNKTVTHLP